jgi:signal transduction histidine kinase
MSTPTPPSAKPSAIEKLFSAETEALRKAEHALTRQQLTDAVYEPFRDLVKHHRRLLRQSMKLTTLSDATQLQLRNTTRDLAAALARVQELNHSILALQQERDDLFAMAVHDLKTPLAGISGLAGLLVDTEVTPAEAREFGRDILQLGDGMLAAVADLVDLQRYDEGAVSLRPTEITLAKLAQLIRDPLQPAAQRKHIRFSITAAPGKARIDTEIVLRIAGNLASNAIKFSPAGSAVDVQLDEYEGGLRMAVVDRGPGISPADQKKLFTRFARLSARPTGGESSSGLGLAIVKSLVKAHGGRVSCESALGAGATFHVELPAPPESPRA